MDTIEPDAIVQHATRGDYWKVRSVSRTKAICRPCTKTGKPPQPSRRSVAIQFDKSRLVRIR